MEIFDIAKNSKKESSKSTICLLVLLFSSNLHDERNEKIGQRIKRSLHGMFEARQTSYPAEVEVINEFFAWLKAACPSSSSPWKIDRSRINWPTSRLIVSRGANIPWFARGRATNVEQVAVTLYLDPSRSTPILDTF